MFATSDDALLRCQRSYPTYPHNNTRHASDEASVSHCAPRRAPSFWGSASGCHPVKFAKPAISVTDQIALLRRRGMVIDDEPTARHYLGHISYYRLRAYWLPFEAPAPAAGDHAFQPGTSFTDVLALYVFDRQLRLLVLDAIERVEVAVRASWAHHMAMTFGPHGYLDQTHHDDPVKHAESVADLTKEIRRSKDTFVKHYNRTYDDPALPPAWMVAEVMSFGALSKWIDNIKRRADRQAIAKPFGVDEKVFVSFAHHVSITRARRRWRVSIDQNIRCAAWKDRPDWGQAGHEGRVCQPDTAAGTSGR
jgi:abortive infection bacteriophage resistance protein